ncbi:MAG TPA: 16S rRNA (adenine(1518)-N(6)/adenine(1519)-N(6))-dimethyltransferase RsmA [Mariprofundaceae bacterium]|nr:16S rRNA (adenine(1518)-N(6)/adenine(1519)-N(6))-dimethyltransferase RsmA [Mariprofundaceae bacterium]
MHESNPAAKKSLGQHFLKDRHAITAIVGAVAEGANAVEIGPGPGAITEPLLAHVASLTVIEKDDRFAEHWQACARERGNLAVAHGDVLDLLEKTVEQAHADWIVGNLPYNISGPLTARLAALDLAGGMVLMYQKEVADRIVSGPGSRVYGSLSVMVRHHYEPKRLLVLPPGAFSPPPRIYSAVITLTPHKRRPPCDIRALEATLREGFRHRRKTIANNFKGKLKPADWFDLVIDPETRPEMLPYAKWAAIARRLYPDGLGIRSTLSDW